MKNSFIIALGLILGLFLLSLVTSVFFVRNRVDTQFSGSDFLVLEESIERTFTPRHDFINIIFITLKNPNLRSETEMRFSLLSEEGEVLRRIDFSGKNVEDPGKTRFQFEPIDGSAGTPLTVRLEVISQDDEPILVSVDDRLRGNLAFSAYYRSPGKKAAVEEFFSSLRSRVFSDPAFFIMWLAGLIGTIAIARREK